MGKQGGIFPEEPSGGVQGLFDQSTRTAPEAKPGKPPKPKRPLRRAISTAHAIALVIAFVGLIAGGVLNTSRYDGPAATQVAKVVTPNGFRSSTARAQTPAVETMKIVRSGGPITNGVYQATPSTITGAGTRTVLEFALTGRGKKQHVVYVAGSALRDASCDGERSDARSVGLTVYDDEAASSAAQVSDRLIRAAFKGGETLRGTATAARVIKGTLELPRSSSCPAGGHFNFTANWSADPKGRVARLIIDADRTAANGFRALN